MITKQEMDRIASKTRNLFGTSIEHADKDLETFGSMVLAELLKFNKIAAKMTDSGARVEFGIVDFDVPDSYIEELIEFHKRVHEAALSVAIVSKEDDE